MTRTTRVYRFFALPIAAAVAGLGAYAPGLWGAEFAQAALFLELNHTDGDLGIHALIDGGPYTRLWIEDPHERVIFGVAAHGRLARQGLTELSFESAEPSFDELAPETFLRRFPEGIYEIEATRGRTEFEAEVRLSHVLAAPPSNIMVAGLPAAEDCDAENLPSVREPVFISWDPVTESHPEIGKTGPVEIVRYQFAVEQGDVKFSVDLPATVTEFRVPDEIARLGGRFKFEIGARTAASNNTAVESCFILE